jgi:beta-lactamase regulating signal transducer with metallopeptidase domain
MSFLIELLARGSAVIGLALLIRMVPGLRRLGGHGRLLTVATLWMVALPPLVAAGPQLNVGILPAVSERRLAASQREAWLQLAAPTGDSRVATVSGHPDLATAPAGSSTRRAPEPRRAVWLLVYLAGVAGLALTRVLAARRVTRIVRRARIPVPRSLARALTAITTGRHGRPGVRIVVSPEAAVPFVAGVWRPTIVFPVGVERWEDDRVRVVLLHELAHVSRRDLVWRLVADVACALHWLNPLVWVGAVRLRTESELACDAAVLAAGVPAETYARELLGFVRSHNGVSLLGGAIGISGSSTLRARLEAILSPPCPRTSALQIALACALGSMASLPAAIVLPTTAQAAPHANGPALNLSDGGPEISSNDAGLQARWVEGGRHHAMFLSGGVDLSQVASGQVRGTGGLVLVQENDVGIDVYEWSPAHAVPLPTDARRSLATGARQLSALSGRRTRFPGSSLSGLPAWSDDPVAHVIQAGWLDGGLRFGLVLRGAWQVAGDRLLSNDPAGWLVLFAYDPRQLTSRRVQMARDGNGRLHEALFIDGAPAPVDDGSGQWALSALRVLSRVAPADLGLPTVR